MLLCFEFIQLLFNKPFLRQLLKLNIQVALMQVCHCAGSSLGFHYGILRSIGSLCFFYTA